jgi:hypothetical protein
MNAKSGRDQTGSQAILNGGLFEVQKEKSPFFGFDFCLEI